MLEKKNMYICYTEKYIHTCICIKRMYICMKEFKYQHDRIKTLNVILSDEINILQCRENKLLKLKELKLLITVQ